MKCVPENVSIGFMLTNRGVINDSPEYQRESGIWSLDKKQLFLDSLFNQFDIPKIYFEDLRGAKGGRYDFAVIDGKQRYNTIMEFLDGKVALASDFKLLGQGRPGHRYPDITPSSKFADLPEYRREMFKNISLVVTMVSGAQDDDIEELFSRLNNGEPLSAAEKRNALGGEMNNLIRDVAKSVFFTKKVAFSNRRYQHYEVAAKFLLIEIAAARGKSSDPFCDLKKRFLDAMVDEHRTLTPGHRKKLERAVEAGMARLCRIFADRDPLLAKQAYPPMYYLLARIIDAEYAHKQLYSRLTKFLGEFQRRRLENLKVPEGEQDPALTEFGRLMQQGTNDLSSLRTRVSILRRYFLWEHQDIALKDPKRAFSNEERFVIWMRGNKRCELCHKELTLDEMEADHTVQHAHGGQTTLENARALCASCNSTNRER
jgi:hypothetical protein